MAGVASRRKANALIEEGKVRVNGKVVTSLGMKIDPMLDKVFLNENQVVILDEPVYIVFNKPHDCITTASDEHGRTTVMEYVKLKQHGYWIGPPRPQYHGGFVADEQQRDCKQTDASETGNQKSLSGDAR